MRKPGSDSTTSAGSSDDARDGLVSGSARTAASVLDGLMRPALHRTQSDYQDRVRLTWYREQRPDIVIGSGAGFWQAIVPLRPGWTGIVTKSVLGELLDALDEHLRAAALEERAKRAKRARQRKRGAPPSAS